MATTCCPSPMAISWYLSGDGKKAVGYEFVGNGVAEFYPLIAVLSRIPRPSMTYLGIKSSESRITTQSVALYEKYFIIVIYHH